MEFGYTILHVPDVLKAVEFYEKAFGLKRKLIHESHHYAEMGTGKTILAFASHELMAMNVKGYNHKDCHPHGYEIVLVTEDIDNAYTHALLNGATGLVEPTEKPWNQKIAYVRDLNGALVELATPIANVSVREAS